MTNGEIFITNEQTEDSTWRDKMYGIISAVWYKGKAIISGALLKQICLRVTTYDTATFAKPFVGTMAATIMWDTMTCHSIMKGAELRAIGVTTGKHTHTHTNIHHFIHKCSLFSTQKSSFWC